MFPAAHKIVERSLHRLSVRHLGENVTDYLGRLRIGWACMWLVETDRPINAIAADVGFPIVQLQSPVPGSSAYDAKGISGYKTAYFS
jgi:hypothetical protein